MNIPYLGPGVLAFCGTCLWTIAGIAGAAQATELTEIYPTVDAALSGRFGDAIAMDGDTLLVGAWRSNELAEDSGAAYVFVRQPTGEWLQQAKLLPTDDAFRVRFGEAVALDGDTALIGARLDDDVGFQSGSVYVFVRNGDSWSLEAKLLADDGEVDDQFGSAVALSGDTAVIGAPGDDDLELASGAAYVFERQAAGWSRVDKLRASDGGYAAWFGSAVGIDGSTAVVGAWGVGGPVNLGGAAGAVYVFDRQGDGSWTQSRRLQPSDPLPRDYFGWSVSIVGNRVLIGTRADNITGGNRASAYLFTRDAGIWTQSAKLIARDAAGVAYPGSTEDVVLTPEMTVLGARVPPDASGRGGAAFVFVPAGDIWVQRLELRLPESLPYPEYQSFADAVAVAEDWLVVGGSATEHDARWNAGSAFALYLDNDGDGEGDAADPDDDGDGVADPADNCPSIPNADQLDFDGDLHGDACDPDDDWDGVADEADVFPFDGSEWSDADGDGTGDNADPDDDNDGVSDADDVFPGDPSEAADLDFDGIGDNADDDDDGDGVCDNVAWFPLARDALWTYRDATGAPRRVTADSAFSAGVLGLADDDGTVDYYSSGCEGVRLHEQFLPDVPVEGVGAVDVHARFGPPIDLDNRLAEPEPGARFDSSGTTGLEYVGYGTVVVSYEASLTIEALERVQVPFGDLDTARLSFRLRLFGDVNGQFIDESTTQRLWLARGLGPVRIEADNDAGGTDVLELTDIWLDRDRDGINVTEDNCAEYPDPNQTDTDGDGYGDVCDFDDDGDGVRDEADQFPTDPRYSKPPPVLAAAILPSSRSARLHHPVTAFATIINAASETATFCGVALSHPAISHFVYQTTDPLTNELTGQPNVAVSIPGGGGSQSFVIALTPSEPLPGVEIPVQFDCSNVDAAAVLPGINTLLLAASEVPVPDVVALALTASADGIVNVPGTSGANAFAVATVNVGSGGAISASVDTGSEALALDLFICETDASAACLATPAPEVAADFSAGETATFSVFVNGRGEVPFEPGANRVYVRFRDESGVTRGSTSVAVRTVP